MDIYGFKTEELVEAIVAKARKTFKKWCVDAEFPDLLEQLHDEMANNVTNVIWCSINVSRQIVL